MADEGQTLNFSSLPLPSGIRSRQIANVCDLSMHILEAGFESGSVKPLILLVHGFPEIAYSWRKIMPALAEAGYYVVACDQRGYGRTRGWDTRAFDSVDLSSFTTLRGVRDMVALVNALGFKVVHTLVGHDMGARIVAWCALTRPDVFQKVVMMSSPFPGPPSLPFNDTTARKANDEKKENLHESLAKIGRKHYKWYYSTREANEDISGSVSEMMPFFRGYFHQKSADWPGNHPHPLESFTASELAKMPHYYVMNINMTMTQVVEEDMPTKHDIETKSSRWCPDEELKVYAEEYARTGFQGGLNWYRTWTDEETWGKDLETFSKMKITVPAVFMAGEKDWGRYQVPGVVEKLNEVCTDYHGDVIIKDAGHWPQQENPAQLIKELLKFNGIYK